MNYQVTSNMWEIQSMPNENMKLDYKRAFTKQEFDKISIGHLPREMEDKWFIFMENNSLYFHRSWTGVCIYIVTFQNDGDKNTTVETIVNRDKEQYAETDDESDINLLNDLIDYILLGNNSN